MIRLAKEKDLDQILKIKDQAVAYLRDEGIDQWQRGYPNREVFMEDIENNHLYVYEDKKVLGFIAIVGGEDPNFKTLNGEPFECEDYLTIHRIARDNSARKKGVGQAMFDYAKDLARERGIPSLRVDTHRDNKVMQDLIGKNAFAYKGLINEGSWLERLAYELVL